ncbi:MAG: AIR carboxylase family protein, partial [Pseudomonadota bacterium]
SIVQMPGGVPVGTMAIGKAGAINAALWVAAMLGSFDSEIQARYRTWREQQTERVLGNDIPGET